MSVPGQSYRLRNLGAGVFLLLLVMGAAFWAGERAGWFREPALILATVRDGGELAPGSLVFYRGVEIGRVAAIKGPAPGFPGFHLRMEVDPQAFIHIAADAPVRIDPGKPKQPDRVTILPGRSRPEPDYPVKVKVLSEVSSEDEAVRMAQDVLQGLTELSRAKRSEAEVLELKEEIERLRRENARLQAVPPGAR